MKTVIFAFAFTLTASMAFAAKPTLSNGNIRCVTVPGEGAQFEVGLGAASGRNIPYQVTPLGENMIANGTATLTEFTTGESLNDKGFSLSISPLAEHPNSFPTRWAKFWAKLSLPGENVQNADLACAEF